MAEVKLFCSYLGPDRGTTGGSYCAAPGGLSGQSCRTGEQAAPANAMISNAELDRFTAELSTRPLATARMKDEWARSFELVGRPGANCLHILTRFRAVDGHRVRVMDRSPPRTPTSNSKQDRPECEPWTKYIVSIRDWSFRDA